MANLNSEKRPVINLFYSGIKPLVGSALEPVQLVSVGCITKDFSGRPWRKGVVSHPLSRSVLNVDCGTLFLDKSGETPFLDEFIKPVINLLSDTELSALREFSEHHGERWIDRASSLWLNHLNAEDQIEEVVLGLRDVINDPDLLAGYGASDEANHSTEPSVHFYSTR